MEQLKEGKADDYVELRFPVHVSVLVGVVVLILDGVFFLHSASATETLIFAAATAAAAGTILATFYTAKALNLQRESILLTRQEFLASEEVRRKRFAMDLAAKWNDPSMLSARKTCREIVN